MQTQNVLAFDGSQTDVQSFRQAKVLREPAETDSGKFVRERFGAIPRAVINDDDPMSVPEHLKALAKAFNPVERNDNDRDTRGLRLGYFGLRSQAVILLREPGPKT
jgi:hypothetical protein